MDDERLRKRNAYFEGKHTVQFDQANIAPIIKYMDAHISETVANMYGAPYPRIEDL